MHLVTRQRRTVRNKSQARWWTVSIREMFRNFTIPLCSIGYKGATTILDAILNSNFMPHILNVYPNFFQSPMVLYKDQESKLWDIRLHTGPPSAPDY